MNIRITRTAVTFCLAIAMAIQPMLAFGAVIHRVDTVCHQQTLLCSGCGCCEIVQNGDKCCCCSGSVEKESAKSTIAQDSYPASDRFVAARENEVRDACHCGVSTPPMNRNDQRNESIRDFTLRTVVAKYGSAIECFVPLSLATVVDQSPGSRADFSQRILCVWRI